ncbi:MAG TPA: hypothetical protein PJ998_09535 [Terrimesophilobacter sp.]|nr:hypothetical protein [Terrimesophilobacter sp.]
MPLTVRYLGMAVSWIGFTLSFTLLFLSMRAVLDIGGFCAEGGPYVIQTTCPGETGWLANLSIYLGLASVGVGFYFACGLGASVMLAAWPILFIGLSLNFFQTGFAAGGMGTTAMFLGAMFLVMGAVPLVFWLRRRRNRIALIAGTSKIDGTSVGKLDLSWVRAPASEDEPRELSGTDYIVLIPLWLLEAALGVWIGVIWFGG